jgi:hypothetical protein
MGGGGILANKANLNLGPASTSTEDKICPILVS